MPLNYTPPSASASGATFAQLISGGIPGVVELSLSASGFSAGVSQIAAKILASGGSQSPILSGFDQWLGGEPLDNATFLTRVFEFSAALKTLAQALDDAALLVVANPGTLKTPAASSLSIHRLSTGGPGVRRTWP
jgi:hypothetical protein